MTQRGEELCPRSHNWSGWDSDAGLSPFPHSGSPRGSLHAKGRAMAAPGLRPHPGFPLLPLPARVTVSATCSWCPQPWQADHRSQAHLGTTLGGFSIPFHLALLGWRPGSWNPFSVAFKTNQYCAQFKCLHNSSSARSAVMVCFSFYKPSSWEVILSPGLAWHGPAGVQRIQYGNKCEFPAQCRPSGSSQLLPHLLVSSTQRGGGGGPERGRGLPRVTATMRWNRDCSQGVCQGGTQGPARCQGGRALTGRSWGPGCPGYMSGQVAAGTHPT